MTAVLLAAAGPTRAQNASTPGYPAKPVHMVVPYAPGGPSDVLGRLVAQKLAESLGQPVVVDNRAGADGIVGTDAVAKAAPDGYTLLINSSSTALYAHVYPKLPYNLLRDLAPVTQVAAPAGLVLVAHPSLGVDSVKALVDLARRKPDRISYSSSGSGGTIHLAGALFAAEAGIQLIHVPYKGSAPAFNDLLSGHVQLMFAPLVMTVPLLDSARFRVLGQTGATRMPGLPAVPTLVEQGYPNMIVTGWFGVWAPAGTPAPVLRLLNERLVRALRGSEIRERFAALGASPAGTGIDEFAAFLREEHQRLGEYVKRVGLTAD